MTAPRLYRHHRNPLISQEGSALVIVLGFVVLLTILTVAFLTQSTLSRQIFNSRAGQTQVDVLGSSAIQFMKADFRQEILSGSTVYYGTTNSGVLGSPVYIPTTNSTVVPSRTGFTPGPVATADPYANIVKISKYQTKFFPDTGYNTGTYPSPDYASQSSTGTPSLNGRYIDSLSTGWTTNGWDKPQLIDSTAYPTALANAPLPDWIYVTTKGRKALNAPEKDVLGRYSYVVYDEGGLLDINSAGYNTALSTADAYDVARKGSLGLADLTQIPGITTAIRDALVSWRNNTTSSSSYTTPANAYPPATAPASVPPFLQYIMDGSLNNGFLKTTPGDQKFLSRQDLLAYQASGGSGLNAQSLAYLGTFSRTINAPTWTPIDSLGETFTPSTTYAANAEFLDWPSSLVGGVTEPVYNRDVPNVRWPADVTITRPKLDDDTGTLTETVTFHKGDPVIQHRFPLSKLQLLSKVVANPSAAGVVALGKKPAVGTIAWAVLYYFGLEYTATGDSSLPTSHPGYLEPHWEYAHCRNYETGDGSAGSGFKYTCSIGEVAKGTPVYDTTFPQREPDFFELLQAGVLRGSTAPLNIFDIGVSAIDQTTPTDVPTLLSFEAGEAYREFIGRKSLPYFSQMLFWPYRPKSYLKRDTIEAYFLPVVWNPNRNATTASTTVTNLRMYLFFSHGGGIYGTLTPNAPTYNGGLNSNGDGEPWFATTPLYQQSDLPPSTTPLPDPVPASLSKYIITFNNSIDFSEPTLLKQSYVTSPIPTDTNNPDGSGQPSPVGALSELPNTRWGFFLGSEFIPDSAIYQRLGYVLPTPVPWTPPAPPVIAASPPNWPATTTMTISGNQSTGSQVSYRLQCKDSNGVWHSYDEISIGSWSPSPQAVDTAGAALNLTGATYNSSMSFSDASASGGSNDAYDYVGAIAAQTVDPRINVQSNVNSVAGASSRLGTAQLYNTSIGGTSTSKAPTGSTLRPFPNTSTAQQSQLKAAVNMSYPTSFGAPTGVAKTDYPGMYSENSGSTTYADNGAGGIVYNGGTAVLAGDGVIRPADNVNGAFPLATVVNGGKTDDRPMILNRPFLSVGELGYTFRSQEWKTLNFSSVSSADSGLLDLFSINDTENADQQSMISGVVDLNTHNPAVLQALISGGMINGLDSTGTGITPGDAQTMADAIVSETNGQGSGLKAGPLLNRAQLATRVAPLPDITAALAADGYVTKDRREGVVRALAEPSDTRTWNLLVDLVAQAGRYPNNAVNAGTAAALSQFDVQGERHYWLHLAIDRYTGKVIDEQVEVVHDN